MEIDPTFLFDREDALWLFVDERSTLEEMASFKFALTLWTDVLSSGKYHKAEDTLEDALYATAPTVVKIIKRLKIPQPVKDSIKKSIACIKLDQALWMVYYQENILPRRRVTLYPCHFKCCVWRSNCRINYRESARKMIEMGHFVKREAFEIMCTFCMTDELEKLPVDDEFRKYVKKITFEKNPLAYYWVCRLTNELDKIPIYFFGQDFLYGHLLTTIIADNWHAIEYFWDLLSDQEKIPKGIALVQNPNTCWFLRQLYWKMSDYQWSSIFSQVPVDVMMVFFRQLDQPDATFFIWMRVKHMLDGEQFCNLVQRVLKEKSHRDFAFPLTIKLWNTADDHMKSYFMQNRKHTVVEHFFTSEFILQFDTKLQFLFDLLTCASISTRRSLILKFGDRLAVIDDFLEMDKIIQLCLPVADDVVKFQKFLTKSDVIYEHCARLFVKCRFAYLDEFLEFFLFDESRVKKYKKEMLRSNRDGCSDFIFDPKVWSEFEKFVVTVDSDVSYTTSTKKHFVRLFSLHSFRDWINTEQLTQMENIVRNLLTEEELAELKDSLMIALQTTLSRFVTSFGSDGGKFFNANFLKEFVLWCSSGEEKVSEFKQRLSLDKIFAESMQKLMRFIRCDDIEVEFALRHRLFLHDSVNVEVLVALDEFLEWYFAGVEEAKKYKLGKIFAFDDVQFYQDLASTAKVDEEDVRTLLGWLLDNDEENIRKFKSECSNDTIAKLI